MSDESELIEKFQKAIFTLGKQIIAIDEAIGSLRASVNVLKVYAANQLSPENPVEGLKQLSILEKKIAPVSDPNAKERTEAADTIAALQAWIARGRPAPDA
jgi:hypothetical protein